MVRGIAKPRQDEPNRAGREQVESMTDIQPAIDSRPDSVDDALPVTNDSGSSRVDQQQPAVPTASRKSKQQKPRVQKKKEKEAAGKHCQRHGHHHRKRHRHETAQKHGHRHKRHHRHHHHKSHRHDSHRRKGADRTDDTSESKDSDSSPPLPSANDDCTDDSGEQPARARPPATKKRAPKKKGAKTSDPGQARTPAPPKSVRNMTRSRGTAKAATKATTRTEDAVAAVTGDTSNAPAAGGADDDDGADAPVPLPRDVALLRERDRSHRLECGCMADHTAALASSMAGGDAESRTPQPTGEYVALYIRRTRGSKAAAAAAAEEGCQPPPQKRRVCASTGRSAHPVAAAAAAAAEPWDRCDVHMTDPDSGHDCEDDDEEEDDDDDEDGGTAGSQPTTPLTPTPSILGANPSVLSRLYTAPPPTTVKIVSHIEDVLVDAAVNARLTNQQQQQGPGCGGTQKKRCAKTDWILVAVMGPLDSASVKLVHTVWNSTQARTLVVRAARGEAIAARLGVNIYGDLSVIYKHIPLDVATEIVAADARSRAPSGGVLYPDLPAASAAVEPPIPPSPGEDCMSDSAAISAALFSSAPVSTRGGKGRRKRT